MGGNHFVSEAMKKDLLYKDIKGNILSGKYPVGNKLPKEFELAGQYAVARGTLREALKLLEDEALIERVKGQGTYVRFVPASPRPVITYLLPCPDYMTKSGNFAFRHRQALEGAMRCCLELNCQLETIAVSPTNSLDDIDWRQVEHLSAGSRVILSAGWFFPLFDFLKKRRCRVFCQCTHNNRLSAPFDPIPPERRPLRDWFWHTLDVPAAFELAVGKLSQAGCGTIAIASNWLDQPQGVVIQGYRDGIKAYGMRKELCLNLSPQMSAWPYLKQRLREWHDQEKFDGLILCPRSADVPYGEIYSNTVLGLPDEVKIIVVSCVPESSLRFGTLPMIYFDHFAFGYQAVRELMAENFIPRENITAPQYSAGASPIRFSEESLPTTNSYMMEVG